MRALSVVLAMIAIASSVAQAQEGRSCLQQLDRPTPDSVRSTFAVTVQSFNPSLQLPTWYAGLLGEGLRQEFRVPPNLVLPVIEADSIAPAASPSSKRWMAVPSMSVVYGVTIDSGKITRIRRIAGASDQLFDIAVARALVAIDSSDALPPLPDTLGPGALEISFAIGRVPARRVVPVIPNTSATTVPLFLVLSPAHLVSTPVGHGADFAEFIPQPPTKRDDEAVTVRVVVGPD